MLFKHLLVKPPSYSRIHRASCRLGPPAPHRHQFPRPSSTSACWLQPKRSRLRSMPSLWPKSNPCLNSARLYTVSFNFLPSFLFLIFLLEDRRSLSPTDGMPAKVPSVSTCVIHVIHVRNFI